MPTRTHTRAHTHERTHTQTHTHTHSHPPGSRGPVQYRRCLGRALLWLSEVPCSPDSRLPMYYSLTTFHRVILPVPCPSLHPTAMGVDRRCRCFHSWSAQPFSPTCFTCPTWACAPQARRSNLLATIQTTTGRQFKSVNPGRCPSCSLLCLQVSCVSVVSDCRCV